MSTPTPPLALVVMPFKPEFQDFYNDVILPTLEGVGYRVERAASLLHEQNVLKDVVVRIHEAKLVIVDLTVSSASVLYYLGMAHGMLKTIMLITRRLESVPFDLRSYRVVEYSTHYKKVEDFRGRLRDLAERARAGDAESNNPLIDYLPGFSHPAETQALLREFEAALNLDSELNGVNGSSPTPVREDSRANGKRPKIYDFAVEAVQAMEKINNGVRRIGELTTTYERTLTDRTAQVKTLRSQGVRANPNELRDLLEDVAVRLTDYSERAPVELPILKNAWERLLKNTADLIASARIETPQDREAALLFIRQLQGMQKTQTACMNVLASMKEALNRAPNLNKNLNIALRKADHTLTSISSELTTEQSYLQRLLNLLQERVDKYAEPG